MIKRVWSSVSLTGTSYTLTGWERKDLILLNRAWFILLLVQSAVLISNFVRGLERSGWISVSYVVGLLLIHPLLRYGKINMGKIAAIVVININTLLMGFFLGMETHATDFLLLAALMPLYFFETKNSKLIFWGIALSLGPYVIYQYVAPYFIQYALPVADQLNLYRSTTAMKVMRLSVLLYLIYHKNSLYEKEVSEKEEQLIGQKKLYECILDQIPVDIVTFDRDLKYTYINSTAISDPKMREWMVGKTNLDYFKYRDLDMKKGFERDRILHLALEKETATQIEEALVDHHGKTKYSIKGASPIYSENKDLLCLIGYSLDITGIKEAEFKLKEYAIELERKNDDLHHFVNATSHDLKTPLRNIVSYLQLLKKKNQGLDEDSLSLISHTVKSVKHLNKLISDIYQYSVADRNDKPAEVTNLNHLVRETLLQMETEIAEKNAEIKYAGLPVLKIAPSHLCMVFTNLVSNALKYNSSTHPVININCTTAEDEFVFAVADNGIGIQPEYSEQIFEIFRRLHTPDEYEGTGVGLAICNKIIENYGGRIWVESEHGNGSTFYFSLAKKFVDPDSVESFKISEYKNLAIAG